MATLTDRLRRDQALERAYAILDNQNKVLEALDRVLAVEDGMEPGDFDQAFALRARVAVEALRSCQRIWDLSAQDGEEPRNV